jgi:DNA-binding NtrC family response regulator
MPAIKLTEEAVHLIQQYPWPGNIRQLKNLVEQLSVIETAREIDGMILSSYLQPITEKSSFLVKNDQTQESISERELMYKFLFDMKKDLTELKKLVLEVVNNGAGASLNQDQAAIVNRIYQDVYEEIPVSTRILPSGQSHETHTNYPVLPETFEVHEEIEESLSLEDREKELIQKALEKHRGKRKYAALELGISERTLYRKIKEYQLGE